ncbi:MAG: hypothetical protein IPN22_02675 [Bacteroidetes bacterium]|nr:hypothetical protein [Bacteroidota bacterium]
MQKLVLLLVASLLFIADGFSQVGINILIPDSSAVLQLESDKKGLGLSRLTTPQRDAITNPLKGLTIFNTTDSLIEYWNGECWLKAYQKNCNECAFTMTIDDPTDTLDRVITDTVSSKITINQTNGNQDISIIYLASLPQGVSVYFNGNTTIDSAGSVEIVVKADLCAPVGGNYPIIIQAFCGDKIRFLSYNVYIRGPQQFTIPTDQLNYDLQAINNLPNSPAQYLILNINSGVEIKSASTANPAYTTGGIDAASLVCINNNGAVLGRGGDGGSFTFNGNLFVIGGEAGKIGGVAMDLTSRTILTNNGAVYGGGSGGGSVGFAIGTPSIPIIGSIVVGFGFCGGGGSESGLGGVTNGGGITIGLFEDGGDATCCASSLPGLGQDAIYPINIPISIAQINITPDAHGGDGGAFGQQGTQGYIDVSMEVCVNIPIIGQICIPIPISQLLGGLLPFYGPQSDLPGNAIKRNNNPLTGIVDGNYNGAQVKGRVGN